MTPPPESPVLIVEDDPVDREAMQRSFGKLGVRNPVIQLATGSEALDYLDRRGDYAAPGSAPRPDLVILDIDLPGVGGMEILDRIKSDPALARIPVVMMTMRMSNRTVDDCCEAGADGFVNKPMRLQGYVDAIASIQEKWLGDPNGT